MLFCANMKGQSIEDTQFSVVEAKKKYQGTKGDINYDKPRNKMIGQCELNKRLLFGGGLNFEILRAKTMITWSGLAVRVD